MPGHVRDLDYYQWWRAGGWILVVVSVGVSVTPGLPTFTVPYSDKIFHALTYFVLMIWFAGIYRDRWYWLLALGLAMMGVAIEFIQTTVPYRFFDSYDLLANVIGIALGWALALLGLNRWCQIAEGKLNPAGRRSR